MSESGFTGFKEWQDCLVCLVLMTVYKQDYSCVLSGCFIRNGYPEHAVQVKEQDKGDFLLNSPAQTSR